MTKPFLFAVCRPSGAILDSEKLEIPRLGGLNPETDFEIIELGKPDSPEPEDLDLDLYAGVFISGSKYGFLDEQTGKPEDHRRIERRALRLGERLIERDQPTLGFCYGMHALALSGGGTLTGELAEDIYAPELTLTEQGLSDPVTRGLPSSLRAFIGHKDSVGRLPKNTEVLLKADFCPVQMMRIGNNIYATQFHPEITNTAMHIRLEFYTGSYFDAAKAKELWDYCDAAEVSGANQIISAFVERYRQ